VTFQRSIAKNVLLVLCALSVAACGGTPGTPNGSVINSGGGTKPPPTQLVSVAVTVTVQNGGGAQPNYISSKTQSLTVGLASVDGNGVSGVSATTITKTPKAPGCKQAGAQLVCSAKTSGSPGTDVFSVTTYDGPNATGDVLSVGSIQQSIGSGGGSLNISEQNSGQIDGIVNAMKLSIDPKQGKRGKALTVAVTLHGYDATGELITGNAQYAFPITLTIQGDANNSYSLHAGSQSGESIQAPSPAQAITLTYDGNDDASSITLQASLSQPKPISKSVDFNLTGNPPPPPVGTIYALNVGTNYGQGATVTEYSGKANGNAAPAITLQLDKKLYARSIAVDSAGNLYVGYLDNTLGFNPSNGTPDTKNLIAIYAPGASGPAQPTATITSQTSSGTALFPLYMTFNSSGGLVTYGATNLYGNSGDAVLTYAPGATGAATPQDGWNFASPVISYSGPSGLALDASDNFYVDGGLKTALGPQYGVYVNLAANINNPESPVSRSIPFNATAGLTAGDTSNVSIDSTGEIYVANNLVTHGTGSNVTCQGRVNVFSAGTTGNTAAPLRIITMQGVVTTNEECISPRSTLQPFFPSIQTYGNNVYAVDDFNNQIAGYPDGHNGTIKPILDITGNATGLNGPIAIVVSSFSGSAQAKPVTGVTRAPAYTHSTTVNLRTR
jgi:hypothetical protein